MSESLDKALDFATAQLASIIDAAKAATPQAVDLAMWTVRLTATSNLVEGGVSLVLGAVGFYAAKRLWVWGCRQEKAGDIPFGQPVAGVAAVFSIIALFVSVADLTNIWNWVGLWHPELYAIHQALGAAGGHK